MCRLYGLVLLVLLPGILNASPSTVLSWEVEADLDSAYKEVYNSLEENRFFVVFEPNIGHSLKGFKQRWGENYNRNQLTGIRSMVFCNAWYANQVSNLDPTMLALCPLHVTLYEKDGVTRVLFVSPVRVGQDSPALDLLHELEADVSKAIQQGVDAVQ